MKVDVPEPMQAQETTSETLNDVIISTPSLVDGTESHMDSDQNLPIVIRKGSRECTKQPLYLLHTSRLLRNYHHCIKSSLKA